MFHTPLLAVWFLAIDVGSLAEELDIEKTTRRVDNQLGMSPIRSIFSLPELWCVSMRKN